MYIDRGFKRDFDVQNREYYYINRIWSEQAQVNIVTGLRVGGKSFALQVYTLFKYLNYGSQSVFLRRLADYIKPVKIQMYFSNLYAKKFVYKSKQEILEQLFGYECIEGIEYSYCKITDLDYLEYDYTTPVNIIELLSNGKYNGIRVRSGHVYLQYTDKKTVKTDSKAYAFMGSLSKSEEVRGSGLPDVKDIILEEFTPENIGGYLPKETFYLENIVSSIVRRDITDFRLWLLGNTYDKQSPYFDYYDISKTYKQIPSAGRLKENELATYTFINEENQTLKVCVEIAISPTFKLKAGDNDSDILFMTSESASAITGKGDVYNSEKFNQLPDDYELESAVRVFYIVYGDYIIKGSFINSFTFNYRFVYFEEVYCILKSDEETCNIYTDKFCFTRKQQNFLIPNIDSITNQLLKCIQRNRIYFSSSDAYTTFVGYFNWQNARQRF